MWIERDNMIVDLNVLTIFLKRGVRTMAYTMEDIRKSQEIFYYLLEKHELREEDEPKRCTRHIRRKKIFRIS